MEKTIILVKHDGVQRGLVGEIIKRFEQRGLKIAGLKMVKPTAEIAEKQYRMTEAWVKKLAGNTRKAAKEKGIELKETDKEIAERVRGWLKKYLMEGPIVAICFEGFHAIEVGRKIVGHVEARQAENGTIRGDYTVESYEIADAKKRAIRNLVHASGNKEEAEAEVNLWFKPEELFEYKRKEWEVMH